MQRCVYVLVFLGLFITSPIFSQTGIKWLSHSKRMVLDKVNNAEYYHPKGLIGDSTGLYCSDITFDVCLKGCLKSEDNSFLVFFRINDPIVSQSKNCGNDHVEFLNAIVKRSFGDDANSKDYVHYYTSDDAKNKFNADTVLSLSLLINKEECYFFDNEYDKNNYSHCTVLVLQKKGHGFIALYCFYDENKRNKDTFMAVIEGALKYRDGKPELERYEEDDIEITMMPRAKQQKANRIK